MDKHLTFGILTVSDSCHDGISQDLSGQGLCQEIDNHFRQAKIIFQDVKPDDQKQIEQTLLSWCLQGCNVILTTGGTGCSPRDVTPEATRAVIEKELPGMSQFMLNKSFAVTEMAMLSRAVCGIRMKTLIINLPGSSKGSKECFGFVMNAIPHAVALINNDLENIVRAHRHIQGGDVGECSAPSKVRIGGAAGRDRESPYPMKKVTEALEIILRECGRTTDSELIRIENSLNRVLAEDIYAKDPVPPFRASMKDGYAVRAKAGSGQRKVRACVVAGDKPENQPLNYDEAIRVSTGAPLPDGADAVVQVEDTEVMQVTADGNEELKINILVKPSVGQDIREIGSDIPANSKVLDKMDVISAGHVGVLATVGHSRVKVFRRSSIGVLSTGNELIHHNSNIAPGQIRDSNKLAIINLLEQHSYAASDCGIAKDHPDAVKTALCRAFSRHDVIITTGGVSMGEYDLIKKVLVADFSALIHFGRVDMKPGKPTTFATLNFRGQRKIVFGLPGNPVSACVTTLLFVIPFLKYSERRENYMFPVVQSSVVPVITNNDVRPSYLRAQVRFSQGSFTATTTGNQVSSRINSLVNANALVIIPPNYKNYTALETFSTILIGDLVK
ncbi:gephyrin [Harmonia axyridis]|uniref:gephyrin n=1 Tax=Harmonia axyridis TaxID=115357 RepID=UPI001E278893|nr:gephyrin [Harmonia axyridis]XP_045479044.1 gephyrin [Harmonia axyridis]XP_045479045.1 gephyrin [Harmonia axyridis]